MLVVDLFIRLRLFGFCLLCDCMGGGGVRYWDLFVGLWYVDELLLLFVDYYCDVEF